MSGPSRTPSARAAWTSSRASSESTSPRTTRTMGVQPSATKTTAASSSPGVSNTPMRPMARMREGKAMTTSVTRTRRAARQPP
jgi:hypothetical protein